MFNTQLLLATPSINILGTMGAQSSSPGLGTSTPRHIGGSLTDHYLYMFRIVIIGETGVDKSGLLRRFTKGIWMQQCDPTVGVDFDVKMVQADGHSIKLQIWDTSGIENFRTITRAYFKDAAGALLIFDITNHKTFDKIPEWMEDVEREAKPHTPVFVLIGSKSNLDHLRQVSRDEAETFAKSHKIDYIEASSYSGTNVDEAFTLLVRRIYEGVQEGSIVIDNSWNGVKKGNQFPKEIVTDNSLKQHYVSDIRKQRTQKSNFIV